MSALNKMPKKTCTGLAILFLASQLFGADGRIELVEIERIAVEGRPSAMPIVLPVKCDPEGNPFLLLYDMAGYDGGPILKVSSDGKRAVRFAMESVPDVGGAGILDFAPGPRGEVYLLASKRVESSGLEEIYLITFDNDGKFRSKHQLDLSLRPKQIAAFSSGDFLIAGREIPEDKTTHPLNAKPFVGIFNGRGQFLRRLQLRADVEAKPETKKSPLGEEFQSIDRQYEKALGASLAEMSDDGNVYLMRQSPTGPVYVISPAGVLVRTIKLVPPSGATLSTVKTSRGHLVAEFLRFKPDGTQIEAIFFDLYDLSNGKKVSEYSVTDARIGSALACYTADAFTFVGNDGDGHLALVRAKPR